MPTAALRPCSGGCGARVESGRCRACQNTQDRARNDKRKFYWSQAWRRTRRALLSRRPFCEDCLKEGLSLFAEEVHHAQDPTDSPQLAHVDSNLTPLCKSHHSARTRRGQVPSTQQDTGGRWNVS